MKKSATATTDKSCVAQSSVNVDTDRDELGEDPNIELDYSVNLDDEIDENDSQVREPCKDVYSELNKSTSLDMTEEPDKDTRNVIDLSSGRIIRKQTRPDRVWAPKKPKLDDKENVIATRSVRDDSENTDSISESQQKVTDDKSEPIPESGNHDPA